MERDEETMKINPQNMWNLYLTVQVCPRIAAGDPRRRERK